MAEANRAAGVWLELPQIQLVVEVVAKMIIQPFISFSPLISGHVGCHWRGQ